MSGFVLALAFIGAWNVYRLRGALPGEDPGQRVASTACGAALAVAAVVFVAAVAESVADWLDVTPETIRIAVGVVVVVAGLRDAFTSPLTPLAAGEAWRAAFVPVFLPLLFSPVAALLALAGGADRGAWPVAAASGISGVIVVVASSRQVRARRSERRRQRLVAAVLVLAGLVMVLGGLSDL